MRRSHKNQTFLLAFIDFQICLFAILFVLFAIAFASINKPANDETIKKDAQFVITTQWPTGEDTKKDCDVDLWVKDPLGNISFYKHQDVDLGHLERDDRGNVNNNVRSPDGTLITLHDNNEIWSMRGIIPGTYKANIHLFTCRIWSEDGSGDKVPIGTLENIPVHLEIQKLNPTVSIVGAKDMVLVNTWDETLGLQFTVDATGDVTNVGDSDEEMVAATLNTDASDIGSHDYGPEIH